LIRSTCFSFPRHFFFFFFFFPPLFNILVSLSPFFPFPNISFYWPWSSKKNTPWHPVAVCVLGMCTQTPYCIFSVLFAGVHPHRCCPPLGHSQSFCSLKFAKENPHLMYFGVFCFPWILFLCTLSFPFESIHTRLPTFRVFFISPNSLLVPPRVRFFRDNRFSPSAFTERAKGLLNFSDGPSLLSFLFSGVPMKPRPQPVLFYCFLLFSLGLSPAVCIQPFAFPPPPR